MLCFAPSFPKYIVSQSLSFVFDNGGMSSPKRHVLIVNINVSQNLSLSGLE